MSCSTFPDCVNGICRAQRRATCFSSLVENEQAAIDTRFQRDRPAAPADVAAHSLVARVQGDPDRFARSVLGHGYHPLVVGIEDAEALGHLGHDPRGLPKLVRRIGGEVQNRAHVAPLPAQSGARDTAMGDFQHCGVHGRVVQHRPRRVSVSVELAVNIDTLRGRHSNRVAGPLEDVCPTMRVTVDFPRAPAMATKGSFGEAPGGNRLSITVTAPSPGSTATILPPTT